MAFEIVVTSNRWNNDPASRSIVEYLQGRKAELSIEDAVLYYDFPAYADYEASIFRPDILLLSPSHGFVAIRSRDAGLFQRSAESLADIDNALDDFASNLHSRLIRSRELRKSRTTSVVAIHPIILISNSRTVVSSSEVRADVCLSLDDIGTLLDKKKEEALSLEIIAEVRSVVEGAKALTRPIKRQVTDPAQHPLSAALLKLESQIANFDEKQRRIALVDVGGPARIRGLAGSGKTVILAMKAAHIHLTNPEHTILITFHTKSLRSTIKSLITKFYRIYSDKDPDWKKVHILHGWGGYSVPGVYSEACARAGRQPMRFDDAKKAAGRDETAFGAACADLVKTNSVKPFYDYVLIDEGQDFPASFYRLAYDITKGERDRKNIIWAYDELQDIMKVKMRQPEELFGKDENGLSLVDLDRSSSHCPPGATNDAVLSKAYRNQRDVLVSAHALGFGIYRDTVQMLESAEHWADVGYDVLTGPLIAGKPVEVIRPDENSPVTLPNVPNFPMIDSHIAESLSGEVQWVSKSIEDFIRAGLAPEEILVVTLDDRHARKYLALIAEQLAASSISSNNVIADPYNEPPFTIAGKVSLATVYRAKGNEAATVFAVGIDGVETRLRDGRNKLFTAFTRSKAWLRVSGVGYSAKMVIEELKMAVEKSPKMSFIMPDLKRIETIQRGFSKKQAAAKSAREKFIRELKAAGFSPEEIDEEFQQGFENE